MLLIVPTNSYTTLYRDHKPNLFLTDAQVFKKEYNIQLQ